MTKPGSKKDFRERWNIKRPAQNIGRYSDAGWAMFDRRDIWGQRKRAYGDYLYHQDRVMFDLAFAEWLENPEKYAETHGEIFRYIAK